MNIKYEEYFIICRRTRIVCSSKSGIRAIRRILHTTSNEGNVNDTFRFRFSGAAVLEGSAQTGGNNGTVENNRNSNRAGNQVSVPARGTLRIKMKDGSTKEIDLTLVREISVQQ